jgi:hypothetical protein
VAIESPCAYREHAAAFFETGHSAGIFTSTVEIRERLVFTNSDFDDGPSEWQLAR